MIHHSRTTTPRRHGQRGQQLIELALVLPVLLVICLGVLDFGRCFYTYVALTNAAREAARYAALNGSASSAQVTQELGTTSGCVAGTLTFAGSGGGRGNPYTATASCQFQLLTPFMGNIVGASGNNNRITIKSNATFVVD